MNIYRFFVLFMIFFVPTEPMVVRVSAQSSQSFSIKNFSRQDYQAENQNWSVTEDFDGYIYSANNIGLLEFDGTEWSFYPSPNGSIIRSVAVDRKNRIFTSGYRELGFWERDKRGELIYHSLNQKAAQFFNANEEFWTTLIHEDKIYFQSFNSLFIYHSDSFTIIRPEEIINSIGIVDDKIVVHLTGKGIYTVEDTILKALITSPYIRNSKVRFMQMADDSGFLIGTAYEGVFRYSDGELKPFLKDWVDYFSKNEINRGAITSEGHILIGTILDGLSVFDRDGKLLSHVNTENGLQNNTVLGILCDRNNNIWLSLDRGIDFISFKTDSSYSFFPTRGIGAVYSAAVFKNKLYLGTNQGVFYRNQNAGDQAFSFLEGTQGQTWNCNVYDNCLFISHNNGTFIVEKEVADKISNVGGGFSLIPNPRYAESLVQCTYSNIVFYNKAGGNWQYSYQLTEFNDLIRYLEIDHLNNVWASHMHRGVYNLKLSDHQDSILAERYYGGETFGKENNIQVFRIENRVVFTTGKQIFTYDDINDTIIPYSQLNALIGEFAASHRIIAGPEHHYWLLSSTGIALFRIENNSCEKLKEYPIELFKEHLIIGYENIIPLSARSGLLCLDNGYAILNAEVPDISHLITSRTINVKSIEISDAIGRTERIRIDKAEIGIPYNRNSLLIKYSFPMYSGEDVKFQAFVEGIDTGWSTPVAKPEFSFKRLPAGEYTIYVKASNNWRQTSQTNQLNIVISPPWYFSGISFVVYLLIITGTIIYFRSMLIGRYRRREQKIREAKERELIRLRNEKLDSELSYKSQELANSTMSIIKKNEFLIEIKEIIKAQKEELGLRYPDKYYQRLIRKIDTNISSIDDWKIFETHFERAHERFLHKLLSTYTALSPGDLRLCAYLRMNLSSKEIAPLMKISVRGVENHRYKLRKKLNLKPEENLIDFILGL